MKIEFEIGDGVFCVFMQHKGGSSRPIGTGSFFLRRDVVLTAKHVVEESNHEQHPLSIRVISNDGKKIGAKPVEYWSHPHIDIALVRVEAEEGQLPDQPLYPAHHSLNARFGAVLVGFSPSSSDPSNLQWVVKAYRVEAYSHEVRERTDSSETVIEFDAPFMEGGNSGGPLLSLGGGVIGVTSGFFSAQQESSVSNGPKRGRATSVYPAIDAFVPPFDHRLRPPASGTTQP